MSTIVVVRKGRSATIAADTLTKWGAQKESATYIANHRKIVPVGDAYIAYCGPSSVYPMLLDYFGSLKTTPKFTSTETVFSHWLKLHTALKDRYLLNPVEDGSDVAESTRFEALVASPHGIFGVGAHRLVQEFTRFYAYGSGMEYALGALWALYEDPEHDAARLAERAVGAAAEFNDGTGLPLTLFSLELNA